MHNVYCIYYIVFRSINVNNIVSYFALMYCRPYHPRILTVHNDPITIYYTMCKIRVGHNKINRKMDHYCYDYSKKYIYDGRPSGKLLQCSLYLSFTFLRNWKNIHAYLGFMIAEMLKVVEALKLHFGLTYPTLTFSLQFLQNFHPKIFPKEEGQSSVYKSLFQLTRD